MSRTIFAQLVAIRVYLGIVFRILYGNLFADASGQIITNSGSTIIFNRDGVSRSIISGLTPEGEPYMRDIVERYDGNMLYHNETTYNPKTKIKETFCWKLDLSKPGASREAIDSC